MPEKRKQCLDDLVQKTYDDVEAYYKRPMICENDTIGDFYSKYDIEYHTRGGKKKEKMNKHLKSLEGERMFIVKARTSLCIVTFRNYSYLHQINGFLFHYILLNGHYRRDEEMLGDRSKSLFTILIEKGLRIPNQITSDPGIMSYIEIL